jgi:hypothetical protein
MILLIGGILKKIRSGCQESIVGEAKAASSDFSERKMHEDCTACFGGVGGCLRQPAATDSNEGQDHYNGKPKQLES